MIEYSAIGAVVLAGGAWLRWAVVPVIAAFDLGRKVGLVIGKRDSERAIIAMIEGRHERL